MVEKITGFSLDRPNTPVLYGELEIIVNKINEMIEDQERIAADLAKTNVEVTKLASVIANVTNNPSLVEEDYKLPGVDDLGDAGTAVDSKKKKTKTPKIEDSPF